MFMSSTLHSHSELLFFLPFLPSLKFVFLSPMVQYTSFLPIPLVYYFCPSPGFQGRAAGHRILSFWLWLSQWESFPRTFQSFTPKPTPSHVSREPLQSLPLDPCFPSLCSYLPQTALLLAARGIFSLKLYSNHVNFLFSSSFDLHPIPNDIRIFSTSHQLPHFISSHSLPIAMLFLVLARHTPTSGPLHMSIHLPSTLFPSGVAYLSLHLSFCSHSTFIERSSLNFPQKITPRCHSLFTYPASLLFRALNGS